MTTATRPSAQTRILGIRAQLSDLEDRGFNPSRRVQADKLLGDVIPVLRERLAELQASRFSYQRLTEHGAAINHVERVSERLRRLKSR